MIRGYIAVIKRYSPLPKVTPHACRKAAVNLIVEKYEFYIKVEGTDYSFKVVGNIRSMDKHNIANGLVRIGFKVPNLDVMISCSNPEDLKTFISTVEVIKDMKVPPPRRCDRFHPMKLKCICKGRKFSEYRLYHINVFDCPFSVLIEDLCASCCYRILENYSGDDARKIVSSWKLKVDFSGRQMIIHSITATSYPFLVEIRANGQHLEQIPEALGSLPCLKELSFSDNRLGQATNWNWLTSPFIRENLITLYLDRNGFSTVPEEICRLKNLKNLLLYGNSLTELPAGLGNLNSLRLAFWEYNIPDKLASYLEGAYHCRCGSVVFSDTIGPVVQCQIAAEALTESKGGHPIVPIVIRLCSYKCYELIEPCLV